jgi:hypothetical protein
MLRASRRTIMTAICAFVIAVVFGVFFLDRILDYLDIQNEQYRNLASLIAIAILIFPAGYWDWKTGSYSLSRRKSGTARND